MEIRILPPEVAALRAALFRAGHEAYPVGGCVRDLLLGRTPGDWDVTTSALPETVMALFPRTIPTGLRHGTVTVDMGERWVEVTTFRREGGYADGRHPEEISFNTGLIEDLARRDFTINAMALGRDGEIIDPYGGEADLENQLIRCVGNPDCRFGEDALRMFRAIRLSAQLGFIIEPETEKALRKNAHRASRLSRERIKTELEKTLLSPHPERAGELISMGLLDHLFGGWPADLSLTALSAVPPVPVLRWRAFCGATGFPITALPTERALRRAVLHPELEVLAALALTGGELCAMGLVGPRVSAVQRRLAAYVLEHPGENQRARLLALLEEWGEGFSAP